MFNEFSVTLKLCEKCEAKKKTRFKINKCLHKIYLPLRKCNENETKTLAVINLNPCIQQHSTSYQLSSSAIVSNEKQYNCSNNASPQPPPPPPPPPPSSSLLSSTTSPM
ncbi:hypothetical protein GQX74_007971 [Glossina fuscipes]|nr:hypothetical protein GQX74_007971 [Glossina fuscipes]